jgi:cytochrome c
MNPPGRYSAALTGLWQSDFFTSRRFYSRGSIMLRFKISCAAFFAALSLIGVLPQTSSAQTCPDPTAADFAVDTLANNATGDLYEGSATNGGESGNYGVVQIAVAPNGKVFIAKMCSGQIRVYRPGAGGPGAATVLAGRVPTHCDNEDGLLGVVLDRNFMTNRWVYVFAADSAFATTPADADTGKAHSLIRYTYDSTAAPGSQLTNRKVLLRMPRMIDSRAYHAAGGLDMGADGVMVIGTGDDTSPHSGECSSNNSAPIIWNNRGCDAQKSSSNTNSLRGKMLRIIPIAFADNQTPVPGIGTTYNIPAGNLWEVINQPSFNPNWNATVDSVSKVRKEIYTMGHRNPYHPRYDMKSGWIFTGEIGLDASSPTAYSPSRGPEGQEEWNLATRPGFYGHPYCVGNNSPWRKYTSPATAWNAGTGDTAFYNCAAIKNESPNNYGIINLPPARAATLFYSQVNNNGDDSYRMGFTSQETSIGGPMYRYDTALAASGKFPPQYEGKVFYFDWAAGKSSFRIIHVKPNGTVDSGSSPGVGVTAAPMASMAAIPNGSYIDMRFGAHDGAMYLLRGSNTQYSNFNQAALFRVRYTGTINNACYTPFNATVGPGATSIQRPAIRKALAPAIANGMITLPVGYRMVVLYDLAGRKVWSHVRASADQTEIVKLPRELAHGILQARLTP